MDLTNAEYKEWLKTEEAAIYRKTLENVMQMSDSEAYVYMKDLFKDSHARDACLYLTQQIIPVMQKIKPLVEANK